MPNRIVREGIITSEPVNALGWAEECFYRRLHSVVDDFGRFHANLSLLRAACYPLRLNDVSDQDVGKWLSVCESKGLVRVYEVDGKRFLEVEKFDQQVRAKKSKFPQPPAVCVADAEQVQSIRPASAHLGEVVVGDVVEASQRSRGSRLPAEWEPSEPLKAWASKERPDLDMVVVVARFRDHWAAAPGSRGVKLDWDATFRNWVRNERTSKQKAVGFHV